MIKVDIFNKSNDISRVCGFKKFFQCIDSEISVTQCTEMSAVTDLCAVLRLIFALIIYTVLS